MNLAALIPRTIRSVSIVGTGKNAGKTTLFQALVVECQRLGMTVGIASIGVDGERFDVWSGREKPPIPVAPGTLVATSRLAMEASSARFEILEKLKTSELFHDVYLLRTLRSGHVKLAGTPASHELRQVMARFAAHGAERILFDGAYDRVSSANPMVAEGVFLVAGASFHRSLGALVQKVEELLYRFTLPPLPAALETVAVEALSGGRPVPSLEKAAVDVKGALTDRLLDLLFKQPAALPVVIQDGTRLMASPDRIRAYVRRGGQIFVRSPIRLLGIAINPVSPDGYGFDPEEMQSRVREVAGSIPVFDVLRGQKG